MYVYTIGCAVTTIRDRYLLSVANNLFEGPLFMDVD